MYYIIDWWETLSRATDTLPDLDELIEGMILVESDLPPDLVQVLVESASETDYDGRACWDRLDSLAPGDFRLLHVGGEH